jgi:hypothetical protein
VSLVGRLVRVQGRDTVAIPNQMVIAHSVTERKQGPVDSMRTDPRGRFHFNVARPDSGAVYVVSSRWQGIGYFSEPMNVDSGPTTLVVFDTTVSGPPLGIGIRHVVITKGDRGVHRILDIFQVENSGTATRVGRDSTAAVWTARLPGGVVSPQPGEGDIPATAVNFDGGRIAVSAPFPPGTKQVVVTYDLPAGIRTLDIPVDQNTGELEVLVEDSSVTVEGALTPAEPVTIESRTFRRYAQENVPAGASTRLTFGAGPIDARRFGWLAVAAAALILVGGALLVLGRRRAAAQSAQDDRAATPPQGDAADFELDSDERLLAQMAALDDKFADRETATDPEIWSNYQQRRAALKAELARRVASA